MLRIRFLGTRGYTDIATPRHRRHSAALIGYRGRWVMIDCGEDWLGRFQSLRPEAVVLTHAHPDHAGGLREGAPCPVFATRASWDRLGYAIPDARVLVARRPVRIAGISFEPFPVAHSTLAPAVGYRVSAGGVACFYVPDLVSIRERRAALSGIQLYIGDGATVSRPLIRRRGGMLIGHAPIRAQLEWCGREGVPHAVFTHCGTEILKADGRRLAARVRAMGQARGVEVRIAHDGLRLELPLKSRYSAGSPTGMR